MSETDIPVLPVGVVCSWVKQVFESEELLHNVTVLGEVSNLKITGGYVYFNLKDKDGLLPCVCFGLYKTDIPKDGDKVFVSGSISFYAKGGKVSFVVSKITYAGVGELLFFYQQLKQKLEKEGLFDQSHKKPIPKFVRSICVVTSVNGAAIRDIVKTVRLKNPLLDILISDVRVQGENAPEDIVRGLRLADKSDADVIIVARGGGSYEDLLAFCDERVVRAIYDCKKPVISAVGHETDTTLSDYVADVRVATPTATGELVAFDLLEAKKYVRKLAVSIKNCAEQSLVSSEKRLRGAVNNISLYSGYFYERSKARYLSAFDRSYEAIKEKFSEKATTAEKLLQRIDLSSPINILKRGLYKVSYDGKALTCAEKIEEGSDIVLESLDSRINAKVVSIENKNGRK